MMDLFNQYMLDDDFLVNSYTAQATSGSAPSRDMFGNPGMVQLEQAMGPEGPKPPPASAKQGPHARPEGNVIWDANNQLPPPPVVDEIQVQQSSVAPTGQGGNKAARWGNLAGGIADMYVQGKTGWSFR